MELEAEVQRLRDDATRALVVAAQETERRQYVEAENARLMLEKAEDKAELAALKRRIADDAAKIAAQRMAMSVLERASDEHSRLALRPILRGWLHASRRQRRLRHLAVRWLNETVTADVARWRAAARERRRAASLGTLARGACDERGLRRGIAGLHAFAAEAAGGRRGRATASRHGDVVRLQRGWLALLRVAATALRLSRARTQCLARAWVQWLARWTVACSSRYQRAADLRAAAAERRRSHASASAPFALLVTSPSQSHASTPRGGGAARPALQWDQL